MHRCFRKNHPVRLVAALALLFSISMCNSPSKDSPHARSLNAPFTGQVSVMAALSTVSDITAMTVTVSGPNINPDLVFNLVNTGGNWGGVLSGIPAGENNRTFTARAFDVTDTLIYQGEATGITVEADSTPVVMINLLEVGPAGPISVAHTPVIDYVNASANGVAPGATVTLSAGGHDPDTGDTLTFSWSSSAGSFSGQSDTVSTSDVTWTAPTPPGLYSLNITVEDSSGLQNGMTLEVDVQTFYETGAAVINLEFFNLPLPTGMSATPAQLTPAGPSTTLFVDIASGHPNPVTYSWTKSACGGGSFDDSGTSSSSLQSPTYTANAGAVNISGTCTFTVTVTDTVTGGSISQQLVIARGPSPVNIAPVINGAYQSTLSVDANGDIVLQVLAEDPEGEALSFSFSAADSFGAVGSFGSPVVIAGGEQVTWTAPSCSDEAILLQVTATDPQGLNTNHNFLPVTVNTPCAPLIDVWEEFSQQTTAGITPDIREIEFSGAAGLGWDPSSQTVFMTTDAGLTWSVYYQVPDLVTIEGVYLHVFDRVVLVGQGADGYPIAISTNDSGANWTTTSFAGMAPAGSRLNAVIAGGSFQAAGTNGLVVSSTDFGQTWSVEPSPTTDDLLDVFGWNDNFVVISASTLYFKVGFGSSSWMPSLMPTPVPDNPKFVSGGGGALIYGTNGVIQSTPFVGPITQVYSGPESILNIENIAASTYLATATSGATLLSTDNGATWTPGPNIGLDLYSVSNGPIGTLIGSAGTSLATSTDTGNSWSSFFPTAQLPQEFLPVNVFFLDADTGFSIGTILSESIHRLYSTIDGGETWSLVADLPEAFSGIHFFDSQNGVAVNSAAAGSVLATSDGGVTWTPIYNSTETLTGLRFSGATGYVSGTGGLIVATSDSGATWIAETVPTTETITGVAFQETTGYPAVAVGTNGTIVKKTAAGTIWNTVASPTTDNFISVGFSNANRGYAATLNAGVPAVFESTDGGNTWTAYSAAPAGTLGVGFVDAQTGYAVAPDFGMQTSTVYKTEDNGLTWNTAYTYNGLFFQSAAAMNRLFFLSPTATGFDTVRLTRQ